MDIISRLYYEYDHDHHIRELFVKWSSQSIFWLSLWCFKVKKTFWNNLLTVTFNIWAEITERLKDHSSCSLTLRNSMIKSPDTSRKSILNWLGFSLSRMVNSSKEKILSERSLLKKIIWEIDLLKHQLDVFVQAFQAKKHLQVKIIR